jgi:hypothetical protein
MVKRSALPIWPRLEKTRAYALRIFDVLRIRVLRERSTYAGTFLGRHSDAR